MHLLHASPAAGSAIAALIRKGAPVIPEQCWCTYPCPEPLFDGSPIAFNKRAENAVRTAVDLGDRRGLVTVMLPLALPGNADKPLTLDPGFTVMLDDDRRLVSFQCVLTPKGLCRLSGMFVFTPRATFVVVSRENVSAWDLRNHGRRVQAPVN